MNKLKILLASIFFMALFVGVTVKPSEAQEKFSTFEGKVIGMRARLWLDVEGQTDRTIMNFRVGRRTIYTPHRYPNAGEVVRVEYQVQKGVPVAFTVTLVGEAKGSPDKGTKEVPPETPGKDEKDSPK